MHQQTVSKNGRVVLMATAFTLALGAGSAHAAGEAGNERLADTEVGPVQAADIEETAAASASPEAAASAEVEYRAQSIQVSTAMLSPRKNNSISPRRFSPTTASGTSLRGARFYIHMGRPDLAKIYTRRLRIRWSLYASGATLFVGGLGIALAGVLQDPEDRTLKIAGSITAVVGSLTMTSARAFDYFAPAHPIEPAVAKEMIDAHNAALRTRLNLGPIANVRIGAQLSRGSAGLSVGGSF